MNNQEFKVTTNRYDNLASERPLKIGKRDSSPSLREAFDREMESNPWGQFLLFVEKSHKQFTQYRPLGERDRENSRVIGQAIQLLNNHPDQQWDDLLSRLSQSEKTYVDQEFYFYISNRKRLTPQEVYQESQVALNDIIDNAKYGFINSVNRDIGRISKLCDAINYFQGSQAKTYLILTQLEARVSPDFQRMFEVSYGFRQLIDSGLARELRDFGIKLMKYFQITRIAIQNEVASNLVLGLGEVERNLKTKISILEQEKSELERQLQESCSKAHEVAMVKIARSLQNGKQPALERLQQIIHILNSQMQENGEPELSSEQALTVLITTRNIMKVLQENGIENYPELTKSKFEISQVDLSSFAYVEGEPFTTEDESKQVECIRRGWKVGATVITPAQVRAVGIE